MKERAFPKAPEAPDRLLTLREAMAMGPSKYAIYEAVASGRIRAYWRGEGRIYYSETDVAELKRSCYPIDALAA